MRHPRSAVVITDDRAIQRWVRGVGARIMSCKEFLAAGASPQPRRREVLDSEAAKDINEELRKLWKLP